MTSFKRFVLFRESADKIAVIAQHMVENQGNPSLDQAKEGLMKTFQQEFQKDAQGALTWLNNLYTKVLPSDYKGFYTQFQQQGQQQPAQGQQQPAQGQQQQQQQQPAQQGK